MIPDNIKQLLNGVVDIQLASRSEVLRQEINRSAAWAVQMGVTGSGFAANKRAMVYYEFIERLADKIWSEIKRVLEDVQFVPDQTANQDVKDYINAKLAAPVRECKGGAEASLKLFKTKPNPPIEKHYDSIQRKIFAEVDLFCAKLEAQAVERKNGRMSSNITYYLQGDNPRININSQDYSINIANSKIVFDEIRKLIDLSIADENLKKNLHAKTTEMEQSVGKSSFLQKYSEFMALAANHATVFAPFLPALAQFLQAGGVL
ncbi:MAG TPA: hypothetical protein VMA13_02290 [Candidatus Saccharimonadales bacterium]|nr:hypothetical protein [Candidatus Saccharimonadales bacterium]